MKLRTNKKSKTKMGFCVPPLFQAVTIHKGLGKQIINKLQIGKSIQPFIRNRLLQRIHQFIPCISTSIYLSINISVLSNTFSRFLTYSHLKKTYLKKYIFGYFIKSCLDFSVRVIISRVQRFLYCSANRTLFF